MHWKTYSAVPVPYIDTTEKRSPIKSYLSVTFSNTINMYFTCLKYFIFVVLESLTNARFIKLEEYFAVIW